AAIVLEPRLPKQIASTPPQAEVTVADLAPVVDELGQRALPLDVADEQLPTPATTRAAAPSADLAAQVQQEQAERSALDKLAQALGNVSAGQPAADAIQQGDFNAARDQLQSL